jgi:hypothetical protein
MAEITNVSAEDDTGRELLCVTATGQAFSVPKSEISPESEVQDQGDAGTLIIPVWLAYQIGAV